MHQTTTLFPPPLPPPPKKRNSRISGYDFVLAISMYHISNLPNMPLHRSKSTCTTETATHQRVPWSACPSTRHNPLGAQAASRVFPSGDPTNKFLFFFRCLSLKFVFPFVGYKKNILRCEVDPQQIFSLIILALWEWGGWEGENNVGSWNGVGSCNKYFIWQSLHCGSQEDERGKIMLDHGTGCTVCPQPLWSKMCTAKCKCF